MQPPAPGKFLFPGDPPGRGSRSWRKPARDLDWNSISRSVTELLGQNERARAARLLTSPGLADRTDAVATHLQSYHPKRKRPGDLGELGTGQGSLAIAVPTTAACVGHLRRGGFGGAGGPSLWRKAHAVPLLNDQDLLGVWVEVCAQLARGEVPGDVDTVGSWCTLHGLRKAVGSQRVRP